MRFWNKRRRQMPPTVKQQISMGRTSSTAETFQQRPLFSNPMDAEAYKKEAPLSESNVRVPDVEPTDIKEGGVDEIRRSKDGARFAYSISNLTTDRTYDANGSSVAELADVLGTLIRDLAAGNKINIDA